MQRPFPQRNWSAVHIEVAAGCTDAHYLFRYVFLNHLSWYHLVVFQQTNSICVHVYRTLNKSSTRLVCYRQKEAATHCSSSRLIGRRSQTLHRTSSQHWCTCHCCTWIQRLCRAGGTLHTQNNIGNVSQQTKTLLPFRPDPGFSLFSPVWVDYLMSLLSFCGDAFYLKLGYISAQADRDQGSDVGPEYNFSIQHTIEKHGCDRSLMFSLKSVHGRLMTSSGCRLQL